MSRLDRAPGTCFCCKESKPVRNLDLYVIGSEGCNLCQACENQLVEFAVNLSHASLNRKKQDFIADRDGTRCPVNSKIHTNPSNVCCVCRKDLYMVD